MATYKVLKGTKNPTFWLLNMYCKPCATRKVDPSVQMSGDFRGSWGDWFFGKFQALQNGERRQSATRNF